VDYKVQSPMFQQLITSGHLQRGDPFGPSWFGWVAGRHNLYSGMVGWASALAGRPIRYAVAILANTSLLAFVI
jgi:hypothetical protein